MTVTLHVCITCRAGEVVPEGELCMGQRLYQSLQRLPSPEGVEIVAVECLSACGQGASVALSAKGRWSYVYGRMTDAHADAILAGAAAYAASTDGIVPWRQRPEIFRKQSIARVPPGKGD